MTHSDAITFHGKVVLITGAAGGLGEAHACELAARGAAVFLVDLSENVTVVAADLAAAGRSAAAFRGNVASPPDCQSAVSACLAQFGRLDILVNNAGLLRDHSLEKQTDEEWQVVIDVHLGGTRNMTKAAWSALTVSHGRIINTTSASGLYGNFGQTNYAAAKMGIVGFTRTCALEGARHGIRAHCIAPIAWTPMTEKLWSGDVRDRTAPGLVSPAVVYLASTACQESGLIIACGGGYFARVAVVESAGVRAPDVGTVTAEWIADQFSAIADLRGSDEPESVMYALNKAFGR